MPRRKKLHEATPSQLKIQLEVVEMPPVEQYPTNFEQSVKLEKFIVDNFLTSSSFTIITGFTTLDKIIGFVSTHQSKNGQCRTDIVLGNEPIHYVKDTTRLKKNKLELKIKDYWLEKGISVTLCSGIIHLIQLIRSGQVNFKILDNLHAKLYVGDNYAVLGSSNFSNSGLRNNLEANLRKEKGTQEYQDIKLIASTYKEKAKDYNQEIIQLLEELLQFVSWQEALAKASAEILESKWLKQYPQIFQMLSSLHLWESQVQAIGQALYIFDNFGDGLLIADPTGSGKTRLGAALQMAIINRQWSLGKGSRTNTSILCPPSVIDNWREEFLDLGTYAPAMISHGQMSRWDKGSVKINDQYFDKAHLLLVDEAHNFLNAKSNRSTAMQRHSADNVVLFTATPINRKLEDIFRLIEILDVDNLSDESIKELESIRRNRSLYSTSSTAFKHLKKQLGNFTIRRTKQDLNKLIQQSPDKYYRLGKQDGKEVKIKCRYPDPV